MGKRILKKKAKKAPVSEEPCRTVESAVMEDSTKPPELAPEAPCETIELVNDWKSPLEPAPEEPCEATEVAVEMEVYPLAVEEAQASEETSESSCEVVEHAITEQPGDDANISLSHFHSNREYHDRRSR